MPFSRRQLQYYSSSGSRQGKTLHQLKGSELKHGPSRTAIEAAWMRTIQNAVVSSGTTILAILEMEQTIQRSKLRKWLNRLRLQLVTIANQATICRISDMAMQANQAISDARRREIESIH